MFRPPLAATAHCQTAPFKTGILDRLTHVGKTASRGSSSAFYSYCQLTAQCYIQTANTDSITLQHLLSDVYADGLADTVETMLGTSFKRNLFHKRNNYPCVCFLDCI
jgi:hypothetical protein